MHSLLAFIFVHLHAFTNSGVLFVLHFEHPTYALDFLSEVARASPSLWRLRGVVAAIMRSKSFKRLSLARLVLDKSCTKTAGTSAALDTLLALASSSAHTT